MCGINGFVQFRQQFSKEKMYNMVHTMNEKIIHRGPDSEGLYADDNCSIGMRRLAVIDLDKGEQPVFNKDRSKLIVFNGELYNYKQLRNELKNKGCTFKTDSDTEVVLTGFEKEGKAFLRKMEGMYAFAIYDLITKSIVLVRDRIGEKPLYYFTEDNFILFGSELKSLVSTGLVNKEIDEEALSVYFQLTYIPAPMCILKGIKKMMPGTVMCISGEGVIKVDRYWELDANRTDNLITDYELAKKMLRNCLYHSVEERMNSDVPLGAFLSGGIDSGIIVGIMADISSKPINTYTIGFDEKQFDEKGLAEIAAKKYGTKHHNLVLDWNEAKENVHSVLLNMDEPFADQSLIATYAVSKMGRQHITVALTGDAGDELFAGYDKYLITYYTNMYGKFPQVIKSGINFAYKRFLKKDSTIYRKVNKVVRSSELDTFEQRKRMMCLGFKNDEVERLYANDMPVSELTFIDNLYQSMDKRDDQTRAQYVDLNIVLEGCMLTKVDRASMLASLETRIPMLDSKVIEIAYRLPTEFKIRNSKKKIILKDTFKDILPEEYLYAPKRGFGVPIGKWLGSALKENLYEYSDKKWINEQGLFDADYIQKLVSDHISHREDRYAEIWTFYVFQYWYKNCYEKM